MKKTKKYQIDIESYISPPFQSKIISGWVQEGFLPLGTKVKEDGKEIWKEIQGIEILPYPIYSPRVLGWSIYPTSKNGWTI